MTAVLLALVALLFTPPLAAHADVTDVTIYDQENVLDDQKVSDEISALASDEDVHIAVITTDDPSLTDSGYDEDIKSLIDNGDYKDIQGDNGQTLKPDVVLIAISPELRKLGTYGGDDISRADQIADEAVGEMKSPARDGDWDQTAITGATSALKTVNGVYEQERQKQAEEFSGLVRSAVPFVAALGLLMVLVWVGSKIIPSIFRMIADSREEKRLLAWSPTRSEVERSVRYWKDIEQRVHEARKQSPAKEQVVRDVISDRLRAVVKHMDETKTVPDEAKIDPVLKTRVVAGMEGRAEDTWHREVEPLLKRVEAGRKDRHLLNALGDAEETRKDALRFVKDYGSEIDLSSDDRDTITEGAKDLHSQAEAVAEAADAQEITPDEAIAQIKRHQKDFESLSKRTFKGPVKANMSRERRDEVRNLGLFDSNSFLTTLLVYQAISHSPSYSSHSSSSSSSYSSISSSISTGGFSGGSGSF